VNDKESPYISIHRGVNARRKPGRKRNPPTIINKGLLNPWTGRPRRTAQKMRFPEVKGTAGPRQEGCGRDIYIHGGLKEVRNF